MLTLEMVRNHDFGTIHIQRFYDASFIRVHVMKSTACDVTLMDKDGIAVLDPHLDVLTDDEIPEAIDKLWLELQRCLHYGRTGKRNPWGLFSHDPLPITLACPF